MKKFIFSKKGLGLFILFVGIPAFYWGWHRFQPFFYKSLSVKDLLKITISENRDKNFYENGARTLQIVENYKIRPGEPVKTLQQTLPEAFGFGSEAKAAKTDYAFGYTAQLIDGGAGYVTMKTNPTYGCWNNSDITLVKYFIQDGGLIRKILRFPKDREGCVGGGRCFLLVLKDKNWLVDLTEKWLEEGNYSYPGKNSVYDLSDFEPLAGIPGENWPSMVQPAEFETFDLWVKDHSKL